MLIKRGKVQIVDVVTDIEHNIDDEGTRKALLKAKEELKKASAEQTVTENPKKDRLEN